MAQTPTEKNRLWRQRHPDENRKRREKDNENRNARYAATGSQNGGRTCGVSGCNKSAQMSHQGGKVVPRCREHHMAHEKANGSGPYKKGKDSGPGPGNKMRKKAV